MKSLQYLIGYIFHKLYTKFRFHKNSFSEYNRQCVLILETCKVKEDSSQTLVNIKDRGGLWKLNKKIQDLFLECELLFRSKTEHFLSKLVSEELVKVMSTNCSVSSIYKSICNEIDPKVNKEISMNLLDHLLTLFVRVRTFSYARDIREKHKIAKKSSKSRSLRTEIKKASKSTEGGH